MLHVDTDSVRTVNNRPLINKAQAKHTGIQTCKQAEQTGMIELSLQRCELE